MNFFVSGIELTSTGAALKWHHTYTRSLLLERISVSSMYFPLSSFLSFIFLFCLLAQTLSHPYGTSVTHTRPRLIPSLTRSLSWARAHVYHSFCWSPSFSLLNTHALICNFLQMLSVPGDPLAFLWARGRSTTALVSCAHTHICRPSGSGPQPLPLLRLLPGDRRRDRRQEGWRRYQ